MNLVERTQNSIIKLVTTHGFDEEGFLPSEGEMAKMFKVSRSTVREAVRSLEVRGFVRREHGRGVLVARNTLPVLTQSINDSILLQNMNLEEVLETRRIIEVAAAGLAALRRDDYDLLCMRKAITKMEEATEMDFEYFTQDMDFHKSLVKAAKNALLSALMTSCRPVFQEVIVTSSHADYVIEQSHHFHRDILACIEQKDSEGAKEAMQRHFEFAAIGQQEYRNRNQS